MTNSRTDAHKSWMATCFPRAMGFWLKQEALHLPLYNKDNQSISLVSVLQLSAFQKQSSGVVLWNKFPEAYNFIKKETLAQVFFCESGQIFKNPFFTEHPHQSRFPILMLHVIHRQLRREYLLRREFLSMVERKISFSHVFSSE